MEPGDMQTGTLCWRAKKYWSWNKKTYFYLKRRELVTGFRRALSLFNFYCRIMKEQCSFIFPSHIFRNAVSFPKTIAGSLSFEDLVELVGRCRAFCTNCCLYCSAMGMWGCWESAIVREGRTMLRYYPALGANVVKTNLPQHFANSNLHEEGREVAISWAGFHKSLLGHSATHPCSPAAP